MSDANTDQEIIDEFYTTRHADPAGANWRDAPALDNDDEDLDLDSVVEEFISRIAAAIRSGRCGRLGERRTRKTGSSAVVLR